MTRPVIPAGTVHTMPRDLLAALSQNTDALTAWHHITPLARNEWICWVESARLIETRTRRVKRTQTELTDGKRRPCCWPGCIHRGRNGS